MPSLAGDFNGDHVVNGLDLMKWRGDFGINGNSSADADNDSDGDDFVVWQQNFGVGGPVSAVPEPAGLAIVLGFALWPLAKRRRATRDSAS